MTEVNYKPDIKSIFRKKRKPKKFFRTKLKKRCRHCENCYHKTDKKKHTTYYCPYHGQVQRDQNICDNFK